MRLLVFFDLPVETSVQRKEYRRFRRFLVKEGFLMFQESVYSKLVLNDASANSEIARLKESGPKEGLVQALKVTEKQYETMVCIVGKERATAEIDTTEELLVL